MVNKVPAATMNSAQNSQEGSGRRSGAAEGAGSPDPTGS